MPRRCIETTLIILITFYFLLQIIFIIEVTNIILEENPKPILLPKTIYTIVVNKEQDYDYSNWYQNSKILDHNYQDYQEKIIEYRKNKRRFYQEYNFSLAEIEDSINKVHIAIQKVNLTITDYQTYTLLDVDYAANKLEEAIKNRNIRLTNKNNFTTEEVDYAIKNLDYTFKITENKQKLERQLQREEDKRRLQEYIKSTTTKEPKTVLWSRVWDIRALSPENKFKSEQEKINYENQWLHPPQHQQHQQQ